MPQKLTPRAQKIPLLVHPDWGHSVCFFRRWSFNSYFSLHLFLGFPDGLFYAVFVITFFNFFLPSSFIRTLLINISLSWITLYIHVTAHRNRFLFNKQPDALIFPILFCYKTLHVSGFFSTHHSKIGIISASCWSFNP